MQKQFLLALSVFGLTWNEAGAFGGAHVDDQAHNMAETTLALDAADDSGGDDQEGGMGFEFSSYSGFTQQACGSKCPTGHFIMTAMECVEAYNAYGHGPAIFPKGGLFSNVPFGCQRYGGSVVYNYYGQDADPGQPKHGSLCPFCTKTVSKAPDPTDLHRHGDYDYFVAGKLGTHCPSGTHIMDEAGCAAAVSVVPLAGYHASRGGPPVRIDTPAVNDYMQGCYLNPVQVYFNDHVVDKGNEHEQTMRGLCRQPAATCDSHTCTTSGSTLKADAKTITGADDSTCCDAAATCDSHTCTTSGSTLKTDAKTITGADDSTCCDGKPTCYNFSKKQAHQCQGKNVAQEDKVNYAFDGGSLEDCRKTCADKGEVCAGMQWLDRNGTKRCYHIHTGDCDRNAEEWDKIWKKKGHWYIEARNCFLDDGTWSGAW